MRGTSRLVAALITIFAALLLQVTVFPHFAWDGVVPDLVLLTVVGAALVTDPRYATLLGFSAGLLLDIAPPADHVAGRWALSLMVVGYVVGRLAHDHQSASARPSYPLMLVTGAAGAFIGSSVFAITGLLLRDPAVGFGEQLQVVVAAVAYDVLVALVVVPVTVWAFSREPGPRPAQVTPRAPRRAPA
ncbi:rod shape-determining protein MreD [Nocardioides humilatus]|uniref:Rod shape-determining protein MreD n=1 Tax=Nocardioides humilatus TaxID=2607660 RepID=A0A5B1LK31_9ACTN|nr:rod shape-determining protein MreD [Nocardioides humilatus]KAA1421042.1 rod shape-determining protein MreD [Nocardioides humilatus]